MSLNQNDITNKNPKALLAETAAKDEAAGYRDRKACCAENGFKRQAINQYGIKFTPTAKTLERLAKVMTELSAETKVVDLVKVLYDKN